MAEFRHACAHCRTRFVMAVDPDDPTSVPSDGAACICVDCGEVSIFDKEIEGGTRKATERELTELPAGVLRQRRAQLPEYQDLPGR